LGSSKWEFDVAIIEFALKSYCLIIALTNNIEEHSLKSDSSHNVS